METKEIKVVEKAVVETTEEIAAAVPKTGWKKAGIVGAIILGGYVAYKYGIKPLMSKSKTEEEELVVTSEEIDETDDYTEDVDVEEAE